MSACSRRSRSTSASAFEEAVELGRGRNRMTPIGPLEVCVVRGGRAGTGIVLRAEYDGRHVAQTPINSVTRPWPGSPYLHSWTTPSVTTCTEVGGAETQT